MATLKFAGTPPAQMEKRLRHLASTLDFLVANAAETGGDDHADYLDGIAVLRAKLEDARLRMASLRAHGNSDWHEVMKRVEAAWTDLEAAFKRVGSP
jgi:hypothetical protein